MIGDKLEAKKTSQTSKAVQAILFKDSPGNCPARGGTARIPAPDGHLGAHGQVFPPRRTEKMPPAS